MMPPHKRSRLLDDVVPANRGQVIDGECKIVFPMIIEGATMNTNTAVTTEVHQELGAPARALNNPYGGARIEDDPYCAAETYRGVKLRYVEDPKHDGKVRVYVESPIDFRGRSSSPVTTHLWQAGRDGNSHPPYICFKEESAPSTYEAAKRMAEAWVRGNERYVATGEDITTALRNGKTL